MTGVTMLFRILTFVRASRLASDRNGNSAESCSVNFVPFFGSVYAVLSEEYAKQYGCSRVHQVIGAMPNTKKRLLKEGFGNFRVLRGKTRGSPIGLLDDNLIVCLEWTPYASVAKRVKTKSD